MKKVNRSKIVITLFIIYAFIYAISNTLIYKINNDIKDRQSRNAETQEQIDITQIQINTKISREQILEQHPDMKMRDNIFYLEKEEDDE